MMFWIRVKALALSTTAVAFLVGGGTVGIMAGRAQDPNPVAPADPERVLERPRIGRK